MELYKNETKVIWNKKTIFYFIIGIILSIIWGGYCIYFIFFVSISKGLFLLVLLSIAHLSAISFAMCDEQQTKQRLDMSILDFDELICTNCNESLNHCSCENGDMKAKCKKCDSTDIHFCKAELMEWGYSQKVFCNNCGLNMWLDC